MVPEQNMKVVYWQCAIQHFDVICECRCNIIVYKVGTACNVSTNRQVCMEDSVASFGNRREGTADWTTTKGLQIQ